MHGLFTWRGMRVLFVALLAAAVLGCPAETPIPVQVVQAGDEAAFVPQWSSLFGGVDVTTVHKKAPRPLRLYAIRIDLEDPGLGFVVTPSNGDRSLDTDAKTASRFLAEQDCQVAINASPYSPVNDLPGSPRYVAGLSAADGDVYSEPHASFGVLLIDSENHATVTAPPIDTAGLWNGVSGFGMLIVDGVVVVGDGDRHPRTAVGTSEDGRYLYFLIIDGRQPLWSVGTSLEDTADWIARFGAYRALNLDGGGSSTLVIEGSLGLPRVLNRPIHNGIPGLERLNGNHVGLSADPR